MSVENIHLLSPVSERRTGTRPVLKKAAKKRCRTREREKGTQTTNRRTDTDETRKKTTWTDKKKTPDTRGVHQRTCVVRCAPRAVRAVACALTVNEMCKGWLPCKTR